MSNVWDYVNTINFSKKNLIRDSDNVELSEKGYVSYIVNKALSYNADTVLYAQEMNTSSDLDKIMQYEYLLHSIPKARRFSKWHKKEWSEHLEQIAEHYKLSLTKAEQICKVLKPEEVQEIITRITNTGGY